MMDKHKLNLMMAGLIPSQESWGMGMERRGKDSLSWYDLNINWNTFPCEQELAIIVTSWPGQLKWLKAVLKNYRLSGAFVILAYDNPFFGFGNLGDNQIFQSLPNIQHYLLAHSMVVHHYTVEPKKRDGWFWDVRYAQGIIKNFKNIKYVYCTNGDCLIEKPEGFKDIINLLGDADLMSGQSTESNIHTCAVIYKAEAFHKIFDAMAELMRVPIIGSRSPEIMLREIVTELNLKLMHVPKQPLWPQDNSVDMYCCYNQDSTWKELLGFRNLFAEQETSWNEGLEPLPQKYIDDYMNFIYFSGEEKNTICKYWETGDRRYLYMWWDIGESSDYNRYYALLEHYGDKPIYEKTGEGFSFHRK